MRKNLNLTQGPILINLILLSLPIMLTNFLNTFYNLVDTYWVGKIDIGAKEAVAVTGISFPLSFFIVSFAQGFTIAATAIVAKFKGTNEPDKIKLSIGQFVPILVVFSLFLFLVTEFLLPTLLHLLSTPENIFADSLIYMKYIMYGMIAMVFFQVYISIVTGLGDSITPMIIQIITVCVNLTLDPLLIFGYAGFPELGIKGAALATVFSRLLATFISLLFFFTKYKNIVPSFKDMIPRIKIYKNILKIGLPASIGQSTTSLGFLVQQGLVNSFGTAVISAHSIGNRITAIFTMPAMGIGQALATFVGQNIGANNQERITKGIRYSFAIVMSIMTVGCTLVWFYGRNVIQFFIQDPEVEHIGAIMFRITAVVCWIFGLFGVVMGIFNGSGHTKNTMKLNVSRLWFFRLPFAYLLCGYFIDKDLGIFTCLKPIINFFGNILDIKYTGIWKAMIWSNLFSLIWGIIMIYKGKWRKSSVNF